MDKKPMTYAESGVDYAPIDAFKRLAQQAAQETAKASHVHGESAFSFEATEKYLAHVEEGLGTKNLIADAMYRYTGKSYYDSIAKDTVASIVNDMITIGAFPQSITMHLAAGSSELFRDKHRYQQLIEGWKNASIESDSVWAGGETAVLADIIRPDHVMLGGSAVGALSEKNNIAQCKIADDDAIILIESSGVHANGITLARRIAEKIPDGYLTKLSNNRTFGEVLLDPAIIYVGLIRELLYAGIDIHYAVNITGHGWRKLMRGKTSQRFSYIIEYLPNQQLIFDFLQEHGPISDREAYGNFNMGAGFAIYTPQSDVKRVFEILHSPKNRNKYTALHAGNIFAGNDTRVVITPKNITFTADELQIR